jgi:hypothetical protein
MGFRTDRREAVFLFERVASNGSGPTLSGAEERRSAEDRPKQGSHRPRLANIHIKLAAGGFDVAQA